MESLKQKTESTDTDQQKSSLGNASFSPSESVLHTLGKDSSQELHDKFMHCTFKPAAKRDSGMYQPQENPRNRLRKQQSKLVAVAECPQFLLSGIVKALEQKCSNLATVLL